ncbi:mxaA protein [Methylophilaceae bacterium]|nr:mxaA protein [Methylophilaceae bacterium]
MKILAAGLLMLLSITASAADKPFELYERNPERRIGYFIGDIIERSVEIAARQPYALSAASLPVKGLMRQGIELREVKLSEQKSAGVTHYCLDLVYQVFAHDDHARKLTLPEETIRLVNAGKPVQVSIPAWPFSLSPVAAHGEAYIEQDMSPYRGPMLVGFGYYKPLLGVSLVLVIVSLFGLVYINGDAAWFPGMGGPFAASYRRISGLPDLPDSTPAAVASIHHAFNQTFGKNLFRQQMDEFIRLHPAFSGMRPQIAAFFELSDGVLFGPDAGREQAATLAALAEFCERCRHCERGLA